jgi:hypothetical protein
MRREKCRRFENSQRMRHTGLFDGGAGGWFVRVNISGGCGFDASLKFILDKRSLSGLALAPQMLTTRSLAWLKHGATAQTHGLPTRLWIRTHLQKPSCEIRKILVCKYIKGG